MGPTLFSHVGFQLRQGVKPITRMRVLFVTGDEYANPIPNPEHTPKYTKVKVYIYCAPEINNPQLSSFTELPHCPYFIKSLGAPSLPEYVATHSQPTGYLRP